MKESNGEKYQQRKTKKSVSKRKDARRAIDNKEAWEGKKKLFLTNDEKESKFEAQREFSLIN